MARPYKRRITPLTNAVTKPVHGGETIGAVNVYEGITVYDIDQSIFTAKGRGVPVNGYVLVAGIGVIDEPTWQSRLKTKCKHGYGGWKCIECNKAIL